MKNIKIKDKPSKEGKGKDTKICNECKDRMLLALIKKICVFVVATICLWLTLLFGNGTMFIFYSEGVSSKMLFFTMVTALFTIGFEKCIIHLGKNN